ncbi:MAG: helix-turn-helix domain-containing protein [Gammaproteobacteria bacterium]|nr:helix-turn-helix domain-containing protein [Gammaproteobacteria bacterium]
MSNLAQVLDLTHRLPTREEVTNAADAAAVLASARAEDGALVIGGLNTKSVNLATAIADLVIDLLRHIANGDMVTLVPIGAMLTTQQAADILNVSRPYLSKLLKDGEIPFIPVGSHRRVMHKDLMAYKKKRDAVRVKVLDDLAKRGQGFDAA